MNYVVTTNLRIAIASLFFWFSVYIFIPVLPLYYHQLNFGESLIGLLVGAFAIGAIVFRIMVGKLSDILGHRIVLYLGVLVAVMSVCGYYITSQIWIIIIARFFHGLGSACVGTSAATIITLTNKQDNIKKAMSLYSTFTMFGIASATAFAAPLFHFSGFQIIITISLFAIALGYIFIYKLPDTKIERLNYEHVTLKSIFFKKMVFTPTISQFIVYLCYGVIITFLPLIAIWNKLDNILWIFYLIYASMVLISRIYSSKISQLISDEKLIIILLSYLAIAILIAIYVINLTSIIVIAVLLGLSVGIATPNFASMIANNTPSHIRGTVIGIFGTFMDIGIVIGTIVVGILIQILKYKQILLMLFFIILITLTFILLYKNENVKVS